MLRTIFKAGKGPVMQSCLITFCMRHSSDLVGNILDLQDWKVLRTIYDILHCFLSATLSAEGRNASIGQIVENMIICSRFLEKQKVYLRTSIRFCIVILIKLRA